MLFFSLWPPLGGGFASFGEGLKTLRGQHAFRDEVRQVLAHVMELADHLPIPLGSAHADLPLTVHASYSREEILTALKKTELGGFLPGELPRRGEVVREHPDGRPLRDPGEG